MRRVAGRKTSILFVLSWVAVGGMAVAADRVELALWPNGLPEGAHPIDSDRATKLESQNSPSRIAYVRDPTITLYPAPTKNANGCAVVICPGGGYNILAWDKEGTEVAEWLNTLGVTGVVLKYRVPRRDPDHPHKEPLQDAQRAIRLVRKHASDWHVDPGRIGILGFSAGGHLTVMAGTHWDEQTYARVDDADDVSCRPDFMVPIYAAYLGDDYNDHDAAIGSLVRVTKETPPTFMAVAWDDKMRGAQAALLFVKLKKAGVSAEVHVYTRGGHGYGLRPSENPVCTWPKRCEDWLRVSGLLDPATSKTKE